MTSGFQCSVAHPLLRRVQHTSWHQATQTSIFITDNFVNSSFLRSSNISSAYDFAYFRHTDCSFELWNALLLLFSASQLQQIVSFSISFLFSFVLRCETGTMNFNHFFSSLLCFGALVHVKQPSTIKYVQNCSPLLSFLYLLESFYNKLRPLPAALCALRQSSSTFSYVLQSSSLCCIILP